MSMDPRPPAAAPRSHPEARVHILEAERGQARRAHLEKLIQEAQGTAAGPVASTWLFSSDLSEGGPWAGVKDMFQELLPRFQAAAPHLVARHDYELAAVLPALRRAIKVRNPSLTDLAAGDEQVRNFAPTRSYRLVHGLIDLLASWHATGAAGSRWIIACDHADRSGFLVRRFFRELARRRGEALDLTLWLAVDPGHGEALARELEPALVAPVTRLELPRDAEVAAVPREEMARRAQALEDRVGKDMLEIELHLPELIRSWQQSDQPDRAVKWLVLALGICNHYGFYEDARTYGEAVLPHVDAYCGDRTEARWNLVGNLFSCFTFTGAPEKGLEIVEREALAKITELKYRVRVYYIMAMIYTRYLPQRDLAKAEDFLRRGLEGLEQLDLPPEDKHFQTVFTLNGLALVRHRQGRPDEALEICRSCLKRLEENLPASRHRLHRSVLSYNAAQVYSMLEAYDEAIPHYTAAMTLDPNYSEYYNERGSAYLRSGRYEEAVQDYLKAIELSPPYPEVHTNQGQCYRLMERMEDAVAAYSVALDLDPREQLALEGRAQAYDALGRIEEAVADYSRALELNPKEPLIWANRATLHYQAGRLEVSLADLNRAIELDSRNADFYQNRAVALTDLGRREEAIRDLQTYLRLSPGAEDRAAVEAKLAALQEGRPGA